ncbi:MAG: hypothetical protein J6B85_13950, partial [Lachnospiraceae bacterium]|nr:hypothetical protein [Lachnospiraceae bacterium]
ERSSVSIGESESDRFLSEQELEAEESFLTEREAEEKITAEREPEYEEKFAAEREPEYEEKFAAERESEYEEKLAAERESEEEEKFTAEQEPGHEEKLTAEWESEAEALTDGTCGCASVQKKEAIEYYTYGQYGKLEPVSSVQPAAAAPVPERAQAAASQPAPERVQPAAAAPTPQPVQAAFADSAPKPVQAAVPNTASEPARNTVPPSMVRAASVQETSARKAAVPDNRESVLCSADEKPLARTILDQFPKMTPFQDSEISECVRIVPQNIGLLPMDAWVLGNNSFLQHGYYNHQHLIFAKKFTRSGIMYLLGVPGYFTQRERNMARMFGFHNFKSVKMRPVQNGEFGYWYVPIVF